MPGTAQYTVQTGDTLNSIAIQYSISLDDLLELNAGVDFVQLYSERPAVALPTGQYLHVPQLEEEVVIRDIAANNPDSPKDDLVLSAKSPDLTEETLLFQYDLPQLYTLHSTDELFELWSQQHPRLAEDTPSDQFGGEYLHFFNLLQEEIKRLPVYEPGQSQAIDTFLAADLSQLESTKEIIDLYSSIYQDVRGLSVNAGVGSTLTWDELKTYAEAYQYLAASEAGTSLPFNVFDPDQATTDWLEATYNSARFPLKYAYTGDTEQLDPAALDTAYRESILADAFIVATYAGLNPDGITLEEFLQINASKSTIEIAELGAAVAQLAAEKAAEIGGPLYGFDLAFEAQLEELGINTANVGVGYVNIWDLADLSVGYLSAAGWDEVRREVYEWQPEREQALLGNLQAEINRMPAGAVLGLSAAHVRAAFQRYHDGMAQRQSDLAEYRPMLAEYEQARADELKKQATRDASFHLPDWMEFVAGFIPGIGDFADLSLVIRDFLTFGELPPEALLSFLPFIPHSAVSGMARLVRRISGAWLVGRGVRSAGDIVGNAFRRIGRVSLDWSFDAVQGLARGYEVLPDGSIRLLYMFSEGAGGAADIAELSRLLGSRIRAFQDRISLQYFGIDWDTFWSQWGPQSNHLLVNKNWALDDIERAWHASIQNMYGADLMPVENVDLVNRFLRDLRDFDDPVVKNQTIYRGIELKDAQKGTIILTADTDPNIILNNLHNRLGNTRVGGQYAENIPRSFSYEDILAADYADKGVLIVIEHNTFGAQIGNAAEAEILVPSDVVYQIADLRYNDTKGVWELILQEIQEINP